MGTATITERAVVDANASVASPRATERDYVVLERVKATDRAETFVVHDTVPAATPDDACWALVERKGHDLNDRAVKAGAGQGDAPVLVGVTPDRVRSSSYSLAPVTAVKRVKG